MCKRNRIKRVLFFACFSQTREELRILDAREMRGEYREDAIAALATLRSRRRPRLPLASPNRCIYVRLIDSASSSRRSDVPRRSGNAGEKVAIPLATDSRSMAWDNGGRLLFSSLLLRLLLFFLPLLLLFFFFFFFVFHRFCFPSPFCVPRFFDYLKSNLKIPLRTARFTFKIVQRPFVVASGSIGSSRPERFVRNTSGRGSSFILRGSMNRIDFTFSLVVPGNVNRHALRRINY